MSEAETRVPDELKYSEQHEWLSLDGDVGTIGVTDYAQSQLGDIVFVELPQVGDVLEKGQSFGTIEAVKTVEELYTPIAGEVLEINDTLEDDAEQVNSDPYSDGWMIKVRLSNTADLDTMLSAEDYEELIEDA
ncbi:MAG: glycine cleavage system protein GcvH [Candidatus Latescibacterota bacterium]|nr:glycine cleavage system protein GcvH [Candidatus Latescibacterota bacterium]MEC8992890.1 glycine cleavage system protein GcvH [Candidatus Latescibacterota bacterium]MED5415466.1 glycine cleavage system protein GcvH [Candidatus Latescibacterota bacterium]MEE3042081.1 glycine cleavage system protein GcvH [Candidatus Latescibacterota bacterium]MEE3338061.1 glycine cleavage system protein GcvH [Candidatus Latescibacterota bacterium]